MQVNIKAEFIILQFSQFTEVTIRRRKQSFEKVLRLILLCSSVTMKQI